MREALKSGAMALVGSALSIMAAANGAPPVEAQVLAVLSMLMAADCVVEAFGILADPRPRGASGEDHPLPSGEKGTAR